MEKTTLNKNQQGYGYCYTDLAEIHRYLESKKMSYYQYIDRIDNDDYIMTVKIIDGQETPAVRGCRVVDATLQGIKNPAQEQGSALTYARRYSLLMAFGLATEDDDAQSLSKPEEKITTLEEAENFKLAFGKYKGKTLKEIMNTDLSYIDWLEEKGDDKIKQCLNIIAEHNKAEIENIQFFGSQDELPF